MALRDGKPTTGFAHLAASKSPEMDPHHQLEVYFNRMLSGISGMKVLLLDWETVTIASLATSQTSIMNKEVFLTLPLVGTNNRETMHHLKALIYCRPTYQNIQAIRTELRSPRYGEYHIFFTNILRQDLLQLLAEADEKELVKQVQEFYGDFYPVSNKVVSINLRDSLMLSIPHNQWGKLESGSFARAIEGMMAVLLAFKKNPTIRYLSNSDICLRFSRQLRKHIEDNEALFHFPDDKNSLLLVIDRREDPVTPLLTQWTYQAMVHELLGLQDNTIDLSHAPNVQSDMRKVVLGPADPFFVKHMYSNFGDLGEAVKELLMIYQKQTHSSKRIESIEDMQNFVESYPQFKEFSTNVSKHVAVVGELARLVAQHKLLDMSQLEQELVCSGDHTSQVEEVKAKIASPETEKTDAVRLALLYALRYEQSSTNQTNKIKRLLREKHVPEEDVQLIDHILGYAGAAKRRGDLFGDANLLAKSLKLASRAVKGVQNVYTQHKPLLQDTLEQLVKGKLKESWYPFLEQGNARDRPRDVLVFILGGATYEEAATIQELDAANPGINFVLCGTWIHSSKTFMSQLAKHGAGLTGVFPRTSFSTPS